MQYSTNANEELVKKLHEMEALFQTLEVSSEGIRKKLKIETQLRRQAEQALTEAELELRSKNVRIRSLERNDPSALRIADSGVITETVNNTSKAFTDRDFEAVTDELINTQEKLAKAEEQLLRSQTLVQDLERNIQNIDKDVVSLSGDDKELLRELDEIRAEIDATRGDDTQSRSTGTEESKDKMMKYKSQLEESREENIQLIEEIACLRNILYDQGSSKTAIDEKVQESAAKGGEADDDSQMQSIRKKMEEAINENMAVAIKLRETEVMLEKSTQECSEMRSEILSLSESLYEANKRRGQAGFDLTGLRRQDNELLGARNDLVDKNREISTLKTSLKSTKEEMRKLKKEMSSVTGAFEKTRHEFNAVAEELEQTKSALAAAKDSKSRKDTKLKRLELAAEKEPEKDAELKVLRSQFKKLSERNDSLTQQVKDVMSEVAAVREKHEKACAESSARVSVAKDLQNEIVQVVSETRQRNREVEDLTAMMEDRMGMTEKNIEALDSDILVAMKSLESAQVTLAEKKEEPQMEVMPTQSESETIFTEEKKVDPPVEVAPTQSESETIQTDEKVEKVEEEQEGDDHEEPEQEEVQEEKEEESSSSSSVKSVLERTRRLLDVAGAVQKLALASRSLREGRLNGDDDNSMSNVSLTDRKKNYDELIKKVADYETQASNEIREVEALADDAVDVRE